MTEAGKRLVSSAFDARRLGLQRLWSPEEMAEAIVAIEAEAVAGALGRIRAGVEAKVHAKPTEAGQVWNAALVAVLRIIEEESQRVGATVQEA